MRRVFFISVALIAGQTAWAGHACKIDKQDVLRRVASPHAMLQAEPDIPAAPPEAPIAAQPAPVVWTFWNDLKQPLYLRKIDLRGFEAEEGMEISVTLYRPMQDFKAGAQLFLDPGFVSRMQEIHAIRHLRFVFFYWPPGLPEWQSELDVPPLGVPGIFSASHLMRRKRK